MVSKPSAIDHNKLHVVNVDYRVYSLVYCDAVNPVLVGSIAQSVVFAVVMVKVQANLAINLHVPFGDSIISDDRVSDSSLLTHVKINLWQAIYCYDRVGISDLSELEP